MPARSINEFAGHVSSAYDHRPTRRLLAQTHKDAYGVLCPSMSQLYVSRGVDYTGSAPFGPADAPPRIAQSQSLVNPRLVEHLLE